MTALRTARRDGTTKLFMLPGALAGLLIVLTLVAACGDGDDSTGADGATSAADLTAVEQYARGLEAAKAQLDDDLPAALQGGTNAEVSERLDDEADALSSFAASIDDLEVPIEIGAQHDAFVQLTTQRVEEQRRFAPDLLERGRVAQQDAYPVVEGLFTEWIAARCAIEGAVRDLGVEVDLGCSTLEIKAEQPSAIGQTQRALPRGEAACIAVTRPGEEIEYGQFVFTVFVNARDEPLQLYRYDVALERELIMTLEAGTRTVQAHPLGAGWLITDLEGTCLGGLRPAEVGGMTVTIREDTFD